MNFALVTIAPEPELGQVFSEVSDTIHHALLALGHGSTQLTGRLDPQARNIVLGAHMLGLSANLPADAILVNLEQLQGNAHLPQAYLERLTTHIVWDYSRENLKVLQGMGARRAVHVAMGYMPQLTRFTQASRQDVDVLFYGSPNPRRDALLDRLARSGAYVERLNGVYGAERDAWIARSKIVLNIKYYENTVFETVRVAYLLGNGVFVLSELSEHNEETRRFEGGVAFAGYDRLVQTCLDYLDDAPARTAIAARGFQLMQSYDQRQYLLPALQELTRSPTLPP